MENLRQVTDAPVSTRPRTGMPSSVNWPVMGGLTAHSTGATLALGDPPRSLNAPGCCLGDHERFLGLAGVTSVAARSGQGSDRQSSEEAFCLAVSVGLENRVLLPHNRDTSGGQVGKVAVAR